MTQEENNAFQFLYKIFIKTSFLRVYAISNSEARFWVFNSIEILACLRQRGVCAITHNSRHQRQMSHSKEEKCVLDILPHILCLVFWAKHFGPSGLGLPRCWCMFGLAFYSHLWDSFGFTGGNYVMWNNAASFVHLYAVWPKAERHWVMNARHKRMWLPSHTPSSLHVPITFSSISFDIKKSDFSAFASKTTCMGKPDVHCHKLICECWLAHTISINFNVYRLRTPIF